MHSLSCSAVSDKDCQGGVLAGRGSGRPDGNVAPGRKHEEGSATESARRGGSVDAAL
ncbi:protein of unknown function [Candidatus Nitrospira inopinata]|uniref:Uncharacterized protein n=1 Tax=Candidatus Nitrospira inopinata TaxID=1715989 RepID=A0A0S4KXW0_9BACT|nr:protein of unknown function [Candidatus Nitrospira inopinata]